MSLDICLENLIIKAVFVVAGEANIGVTALVAMTAPECAVLNCLCAVSLFLFFMLHVLT